MEFNERSRLYFDPQVPPEAYFAIRADGRCFHKIGEAFNKPFRIEGIAQYLKKLSSPHPVSTRNTPTKTNKIGAKMKTRRRSMDDM